MGHMNRTTEAIIGTREGVVKAWAIKRRSEGERWNIENINGVRGTPAEPVPGQGKRRVPIKVRMGEANDGKVDGKDDVDAGMEEQAPRRARITKKYYERYGYTEGCEGCGRLMAGLGQRPHTESCRERMEETLEGDEEGRAILIPWFLYIMMKSDLTFG